MTADTSIATLIASAERGDESAAETLFATLYAELHRIAERELARNWGSGTLAATSLLHQAYLDISRREGVQFPDRPRFMAYAARVMRGLVIEYVRNRQALKRGSQFEITELTADIADSVASAPQLTEIGAALDKLAAVEPMLAEIVDLKFFCGFSFNEIAAMKGLSSRTVQRHWQKARAYLHRVIDDSPLSDGDETRPEPDET